MRSCTERHAQSEPRLRSSVKLAWFLSVTRRRWRLGVVGTVRFAHVTTLGIEAEYSRVHEFLEQWVSCRSGSHVSQGRRAVCASRHAASCVQVALEVWRHMGFVEGTILDMRSVVKGWKAQKKVRGHMQR